ncbi:MAG: efflux transporter outer membrane subunit [Betaproteobacteria bacterium]|nr:efflux transporter outer membrane subunit [Betaproteobacteria bacterium]
MFQTVSPIRIARLPYARRSAALLLLAVILAGCASSDGLSTRATPAKPEELKAEKTLGAAAAGPWPAADWWKRFGDPQLDALVDEALKGSPNMRLAQARVDRASATVLAAGAAFWPTASAGLDSTRQRYSANGIFPPPIAGGTFTTTNIGVSFGYEFDFWGRNRAAYEAAIGREQAAQADVFAARLVLSSAIAAAYVQLSRSFDQLDIARRTLEEREAIQRLTTQRVSAGLDSKLELKQVETSIPAARARVAQIEEEIALERNQLAALAGQGPDRGLALERPKIAAEPVALPSALPADLLGRRPDVVASRLRVEAAARDVTVTKAAFYPNVNLSALLGYQSISWSKLLQPESAVPSIGFAIRLPLFDAGRLRGELAGRHADYDVAVEQYNQSLVDALREVVDQLASWRSLETQRSEVDLALGSAEEAYQLATTRYQGGLGTLLQVIAAEMAVLEQRSLRADLQARAATVSINLAKALGGGFMDADAQRPEPKR